MCSPSQSQFSRQIDGTAILLSFLYPYLLHSFGVFDEHWIPQLLYGGKEVSFLLRQLHFIFILPGIAVPLGAVRRSFRLLVNTAVPMLAVVFLYAQLGNYLFVGVCDRQGGPVNCEGNNYFGTVGDSFWTLVQLMSFDGWSSSIAR